MILITGPTSFIGRSVIPKLLKHFQKKELLCLCWDKDENVGIENRILLENKKVPTHFVDLVTKKGLAKIPKSPEIIIHMAANTDTSTKNHKVNDLGTKNFIKSLGNLGPKTHIIYTSTTTFLGGRKDCRNPLNEKSQAYPTNEYGRSKLRAEEYLIKESIKQKFRLTILRLNTVYGTNSRPKSMFKLLPEKIAKKSVFTRLNWPGLTSVVEVNDVASAILHFSISKPPKPGTPANYILTGESLTMADICKIMHKALNIPYRPIELPKIIWSLAKKIRNLTPYLEFILPQNLYNSFWRASLIIDNAVWCKSKKINEVYPKWKPKKLKEVVNALVSNP